MNKETNMDESFTWEVHEHAPEKRSIRVIGRWEKLCDVFYTELKITKDGFSKWICFKFSDYRIAMSAAAALRGLNGKNEKMPYGYPFSWETIATLYDFKDHIEVWAQKIVRCRREFKGGRNCFRRPVVDIKIGDLIIRHGHLKIRVEGIWPEVRVGWGVVEGSDSPYLRGQHTFCICSNCIEKLEEKSG
jgi:hypothetical protein